MRPKFVPFDQRLGSIPLVTEQVVDVRNAEHFPNSVEAIEHSRAMDEQREYARVHRAEIDAEWNALEAPPLTIAQHIDHARKTREANYDIG